MSRTQPKSSPTDEHARRIAQAIAKGRPPPFTLTVTALRVSAGAGFVVALCGHILTMPGLPKEPAASRIDVERGPDGAYRVKGLT